MASYLFTIVLRFAGFDTGTSTSLSAFFELGLDYRIHEELRAEQDAVVRRLGTKITYNQILNEMPLLDSYIREIIRLYPAGSGVFRRSKTDIELCGVRVSAGTKVYIDHAGAGRDPSFYIDPENIILDRHVKRPAYTPPKIIGFGVPGSAHFCLGAQLASAMLKTELAISLREYDFELVHGQKRIYGIFPHVVPRSGVLVEKFEPRE